MKRGIEISCWGVSEKKGKVRVRGKVNLAITWKGSVVEQNGIKIWIIWEKSSIEEACGGVSEKKDKVTLLSPKIKPPFQS